ncbi:ATPase family associated with various cellular activities domain protein [Mycobacterium xenopi 4042]|uniref:ATPase family associated with various cellular activities domain protein n=1 Tax=Mycobacterium xenopi 4042 TaxID=1299334 RepID=X7Z3N8_MYCXE|nr:ATPase family associated with various cellular activities domain protein [Mycobacterium xenopi 4042]EUA33611.1 ATPase family associated with various cellular activities domain protein [Mycobacterium xenopi 3993]
MTAPNTCDVEFRWRASPLTVAIATCGGAALAAAVIGSRWQLIAFAAPLVGVLCSITWQPPVPKISVHGQPGSQRCFETEQAQLTVWVTAESESATVQLDVSATEGMQLAILDDTSSQRKSVAVTANRWGVIRSAHELTWLRAAGY